MVTLYTANRAFGGLREFSAIYKYRQIVDVENDKLTEYTLSSFKFYENSEFKYLQLIFPDLNGFFPNEPEYEYDQKILGE